MCILRAYTDKASICKHMDNNKRIITNLIVIDHCLKTNPVEKKRLVDSTSKLHPTTKKQANQTMHLGSDITLVACPWAFHCNELGRAAI
jgi:hypothetical protein